MAKTKQGKKDVDSYTVRGTNKVVHVGDCVLMRASDSDNQPYVARVEKMEADGRGSVRVRVRWYYRPEESKGGRRQFHGAKELFLSDHFDLQSAHTIEGKCVVHSFKNYTKLDNVGPEDFFCRFEYKAATGSFTPDRVAVYCKCEMPYNPDDLMVQCDACKDWFHPSCMSMTIEQAKKLDHFVCSDCLKENGSKRLSNAYGTSPNSEPKREQEWNISRKELMDIVEIGILSEADLDQIISSDFNPNRCGFEDKGEIWVENILNLGVSPAKLVENMKERFVSSGGAIFEGKSLSSIYVYDDLAVLKLSDGDSLSCRLVVDAMGNFSPIVRQIRSGRKPDGMCLVVGACAHGFEKNTTSDIIFSSSSVKRAGNSGVQLFWEAFPAGSGPNDRTTYMFTYVDPKFGGPKLEELLEVFWDLMPAYQDVVLENLDIRRVIFGIFPTYRDSPLPAAFDRVLQVGDASGIQSPVSFGGFGSLTRHLGRLSSGICEAVEGDFLDAHSLQLLNPYMPNLSASWLFQRAMSVRPHVNVSPTFINELLFANFQSMQKLGDSVLRPFLQDVIQFGPLVKTLGLVMVTRPQILPSIFKQVGLGVILEWSGHFMMLGYYTFLSTFIDPVLRSWVESLPPRDKYQWKRYLEAWRYGAGLDYHQGE